jgi:hypothetical protein
VLDDRPVLQRQETEKAEWNDIQAHSMQVDGVGLHGRRRLRHTTQRCSVGIQ